jgi:hypothetical protein
MTPKYFGIKIDGNNNKLCEIILNFNYITNYCISQTWVTWQGTNYEIPEDETVM